MSDLISREAAEAIFRNARKSLCEQSRKGKIEHREFLIRDMMLLNAEQFIHLLPPVEPERKTGKWLWDKRTGTYHCSECGHDPLHESVGEIEEYKYCMNCGTRMEVDR